MSPEWSRTYCWLAKEPMLCPKRATFSPGLSCLIRALRRARSSTQPGQPSGPHWPYLPAAVRPDPLPSGAYTR